MNIAIAIVVAIIIVAYFVRADTAKLPPPSPARTFYLFASFVLAPALAWLFTPRLGASLSIALGIGLAALYAHACITQPDD